MKRITQLVMVAGLVFGGQSVWAGEGQMAPENDVRDNVEMNVAAIGASSEQAAVKEAKPGRKSEGLLETLGIAGHGPFPSRGGSISD